MEKIILGGAIVYLDFALLTDVDGQLGVISYFNRSNSQVRSFGASLTFEKGIQLDKNFIQLKVRNFRPISSRLLWERRNFTTRSA